MSAPRSATEHDLPTTVTLTTAFYEGDGFEIASPAAFGARLGSFLNRPDASLTVAATPDATRSRALAHAAGPAVSAARRARIAV